MEQARDSADGNVVESAVTKSKRTTGCHRHAMSYE